MKRYMTLGFAMVLALSLAVPALGGPSNPVASSAVTVTQALKKAKKAKSAADAAQATANSAQSAANAAQSSANQAQNTANTANTTANNALAEAADVSANDLNMDLVFDSSASDSTTPKSVSLTCDLAGQEPISGNGSVGLGIVPPEEVDYDGATWYLGLHAIAHEETAFAGNWIVTIDGNCIDSAG